MFGKLKKLALYAYLLLLNAILFASCSSDNEPTDYFTNSAIIGRWETYSPVQDNSYFYFSKSGQYVYYNGDLLQESVSGAYTYQPGKRTIHCERDKGFSFTIDVTFDDTEHATFVWHYDVLDTKNTIKVKRTSQQ